MKRFFWGEVKGERLRVEGFFPLVIGHFASLVIGHFATLSLVIIAALVICHFASLSLVNGGKFVKRIKTILSIENCH